MLANRLNFRKVHKLGPVVSLVLALIAAPAFGSDHADPIHLKRLEAGLTGLFVFPEGDRMIVILGLRRALTSAPPYDLEPYTYNVYMDLHSEVSYDVEQDRLRYGGTVVDPERIRPDVALTFRLNDDASLREKTFTGLSDTSAIRVWSGVRDDPFIQPRFFGTNVIAIAASIPFSAFPEGQQDWLLWATSSRGDRQIDHVGRANRTMLPRFDLLNTVPPHRHVAVLKERHEDPTLLQDIARVMVSPLFAARTFDFVPDVMIFNRRRPAGFPNGRKLTDNVADLTCRLGDCLLWDLSFMTSKQWPRPTANDKPFLDEFPYLAAPWPDKAPPPSPSLTPKNKLLLALIGGAVVGFYLLPWVLYWRCRRRAGR